MSEPSAMAPEAPSTTGSAARTYDMTSLLAHRRWVRREWPFAHVLASNVFVPEFYAELDAQFHAVEDTVFQRNMKGYDASGTELSLHCDGPLGVFASRGWHDMIADIWGLDATGDVAGSLHHHDPGGKSGWPHNDLAPGWFASPPADRDSVRLSNSPDVDYFRGPRREGVEARETVRAVAILFYLGNPEWQPGDGGETAFFASCSGAAAGPSAAIPPINNSMVMFECTPFSWHSFVTNRKPRNSLVMWLHRTKEEAVTRWGDDRIVYW